MSIFDNKSGQHVGDGSSAIQVAGDYTVGNTTTEVISLCELVVKSQMASLREDAYNLVNQRANEFGSQISSQLSQVLDEELTKKLANPDIQYSINQAVVQVARKGFNEKSELLKELIVSKIKNNEEENDLLIDHALEITPKLSTNEIKFLAFIYFLRHISKMLGDINITNLAENNRNLPAHINFTLEQNHSAHKKIYANFQPDYQKILTSTETLRKINKDLLSIKGIVFSDKTYSKPYQEVLGKRCGIEQFSNENEFYEIFPAVKEIVYAFNIQSLEDLNNYVLTPIGLIVAENYLKARDYL